MYLTDRHMEKLKNLLQDVKPYNDFVPTLLVSLLAAHYILTHTTPYGFFEVVTVNGYGRSLLSSFIIALILVHTIRKITLALDNYIPYVRNWKLRTTLQVICGVVGVAMIAIGLAFAYFFLAGETKRLGRYLNHDFPIVLAFIIIANAYYFISYALRVNTKLFHLALQLKRRQQRQEEELKFKAALLVTRNEVSDNPIAFIIRVDREYFVTYFDGTKYVWHQSIKASIAQLPPNDFFLINPRCIVNRMAIVTIKPLPPKRFELVLKATLRRAPYFPKFIVSQANRQKFKTWLAQSAD